VSKRSEAVTAGASLLYEGLGIGDIHAKKNFYRPKLDVVRFFAFLCVFFHHTVQRFTLEHGRAYDSLIDALGFGLSLFFTLSAYLITSLLLRERERTGAIHLRAFYIRRALRIWPLYVLGLLLNVVVFRLVGQWDGGVAVRDVALGLVMCGNLVPLNDTAHMTIGALWNISLEEQFYVFWPSTMRWLEPKLLLLGAISIIVVADLMLVHLGRVHAEPDIRVWTNSFVQFEFFATGILLALHEKKRRVFSPAVSGLLCGAAGLLWFAAAFRFGIKGHPIVPPSSVSYIVGYAMVSIGCAIFLIAVPGFQRWPAPFVYLGKISFGLYVFHGPVIILAGKYLDKRIHHGHLAVSFAITIVCAALSYQYFETPFLRLKRSHELVPSRPV
jgi:peptidoglycan/LPS O-acetylase OafA/YrhL